MPIQISELLMLKVLVCRHAVFGDYLLTGRVRPSFVAVDVAQSRID
jgi:hypothetical protein